MLLDERGALEGSDRDAGGGGDVFEGFAAVAMPFPPAGGNGRGLASLQAGQLPVLRRLALLLVVADRQLQARLL